LVEALPDVNRIQPADGKFPGSTLEAIKLLHLERKILLHGHEPLDADSTPTLVGRTAPVLVKSRTRHFPTTKNCD
jgi:hypothetical protein